jgi:iron complex outermembrane receptor protein
MMLVGRSFARISMMTAVATSAMLAAPAMAQAQDAEVPQEDVVVTGRSFLAVDTSGATNLPIAIEKVPQAITVVSEDFIKGANLKTLADIADYTAGAVNSGNALGQATSIMLRGFGAGRAIDGLTVNGGAFEPDNAIIDRLEFVKGPSSVVYGVASPGGIVNYVTKSAKPGTPSYGYAQVGSWNSFRLEGQLAGALNSAKTIRAITVVAYDQGDAYTDVLHHTNVTTYAGVDTDITDRLTASLHGGYMRQIRTAFDGIPTEADGSIAPLPATFFIGNKDMKIRTSVYHAEGDVSWKTTDLLKISVKGNYQHTDTTGFTPFGQGLQADGTLDLGLEELDASITSRSIGVFANYALDGLGLSDSFITISGLSQKIHDESLTGLNYGASVNVFDGPDALAAGFDTLRDGMPQYAILQVSTTNTVSAQSLIKPIAPIGILLGVSYSKAKVDVDGYTGPATYDFDGKVSLRGGLTYEPMRGLNTYASFSQSFVPQPYLDIDQAPLAPLEGNQYEVGAKYRASTRLLVTGAVYRIIQKNNAVYDQSNAMGDFYRTQGKVRHQGIELEATGSVLPQLELNASYTYLETRILDDSDPATIGKSEMFQPKNTASLYTTYTLGHSFLHGASAGGGFRYVSSFKTSYDESTKPIAGRFLVDANIGYEFDGWLLQLNARNIFSKRYYTNTYKILYYGNTVGDGANVSLSVQRKF